MLKSREKILLSIFFFFIPINFYIIGDLRGFGIQTIFFRYQITDLNTNFITFIRDFQYILEDHIHGITAISYIIWGIGAIFIIFCLVLVLIQTPYTSSSLIKKMVCFFLSFAIIAFMTSLILQYGPFLYSDVGLSIPFGIPLLIFIDYLLIRKVKQENQKLIENNIFTETEH